jgi:hypothetical protein
VILECPTGSKLAFHVIWNRVVPVAPNKPALEIESRYGRGARGELLQHLEIPQTAGWLAVLAGIELRHDFLSEG